MARKDPAYSIADSHHGRAPGLRRFAKRASRRGERRAARHDTKRLVRNLAH